MKQIEVAAPIRGQSTRDRILDAAEELFSKQGVNGTSLREITATAGVNLAAVNYHYQSKDALLRAVIARRVGPVNERRIARLDEIERAFAPQPPPLAPIFEALVLPVLEMRATAPHFVPLMGRIYVEPGELVESLIHEHMAPVARRFLPALQRVLPHLTFTDLLWRLHFTVGAMAHIMAGAAVIRAVGHGETDPTDAEAVRRQLIPFLVAGFMAPAPKEAS